MENNIPPELIKQWKQEAIFCFPDENGVINSAIVEGKRIGYVEGRKDQYLQQQASYSLEQVEKIAIRFAEFYETQSFTADVAFSFWSTETDEGKMLIGDAGHKQFP